MIRFLVAFIPLIFFFDLVWELAMCLVSITAITLIKDVHTCFHSNEIS